MRIYYSKSFERQYRKLPVDIQELAEKREKIFRQNPFDPRLRTHKLKGQLQELWSFSVNHSHRLVFGFDEKGDVLFYAIGNHDIYS